MTRDFDQHVRERWAGKAAVYERGFAALCAGAAPALLDAAAVKMHTRLLDVGTGTGTVARLAKQRGAIVAAVDAERSMVEAAREHVADVRLGALPDLPFVHGTFDAAVANFVINHVGDPAAAVTGMRRVVRPGGIVAVTIWASPSPTQQIIADAVGAAGVEVPPVPRLDPERDFDRTVDGLARLLVGCGLGGVRASAVAWSHRVDPDVWWAGAAGGPSAIAEVVTRQPPERIEKIKQEYDRLIAPMLGHDGMLTLPVAAILANGRA